MPNGIQQDWLNHKELMLIKGIGKTPGDSNSAEVDPVVVDLLSGLITLEADDGWSPQIPPLKNGGVWADSPINDGRELLAASNGNVIETITVNIADAGYLNVNRALSSLMDMVADCRDFWQTETQINPVYLRWYVSCGAGPQFALIYNIDLAPIYLQGAVPSIRVTLKIEREPAWRPFPPGSNPKQWAYYINTAHPQWNVNGASLVTGSDHLITQTIQNKLEWTPAAYGLQSTLISQNFIDITASQVPGDAPALLEFSVTADANSIADVYVGLCSKPQTGRGHDNVARVNGLILNAADGTVGLGTKTVVTNVTGVRSNGSAVNFSNVQRTSTGVDGAFADFVTWGESGGTGLIKLDRNFFRGTYAIFARCRNSSAAAPVLADMRVRVLIDEYENNATQYINTITLQDANPAAGAGLMRPLFMGVITIPFEGRSTQSLSGYGLQLQEATSNLRIRLQQKVDVATANRTFEIVDLVFLPIDEALSQVSMAFNSLSTSPVVVYDNTGYLMHGDIQLQSVAYLSTLLSGGVNAENRGQSVNLLPNTNQRLYFMVNGYDISAIASTVLLQSLTVRLNIMPRWYGIRDT